MISLATLPVAVGWTVLLAAFLLANEVASRRWTVPTEVSRKIAHLGSSVLVAISCLQLPFRAYLVIGPLFALALLLARRRMPLRSLSARADASWGEVLFGLGVAGAALVAAGRGEFVAAVLALGLADTTAYVVGRRWPVRRLVLGRSLGGLLGCSMTAPWCACGSGSRPPWPPGWPPAWPSWSAHGAGTTCPSRLR